MDPECKGVDSLFKLDSIPPIYRNIGIGIILLFIVIAVFSKSSK